MTKSKMGKGILIMLVGLLGACGAISDAQTDNVDNLKPTVVAASEYRPTAQSIDPAEVVQAGEDPESSNLTADCVYIQWCNAPGADGTVCRLRSGCPCNTAALAECIRDAYSVCGTPVSPWQLYC